MNVSRRSFNALALGGALAASLPAWAAAPSGWQLGFTTPPHDLDGELRRLSGRLPQDLEGVFYRIGPAQFERAGERLGHWFDGDGMVQRYAIGGGRIRHHGRFVETDKRRAEQQAGRFLYFGYGFAPKNPAPLRWPDDLNAANTNILSVGDEIWALWEGGSPWRLKSEDLATIGRKAFSDQADGLPFSAHPKQGPDGDVWNFGAFGGRCVIWRLSKTGALLTATMIDLPAASLMHDFSVTQSKIVLVLPPMLARAEGGGPALVDRYSWRPEEPLRVLVLDKDDLNTRRLYELPPRFLFHIGNAWEDGSGVIRLDAFLFDDAQFATEGTRDLPQGRYVEPPNAHPTLITLRPDGRAEMSALDGAGEFPRVDPRRIGSQHRYTYGVVGFGVAQWDWRSGRQASHIYSPNHWSEEPVFVPKPGRTREADGWVIATALNTKDKRTELNIFDARRIEDGPIAQFACPYATPLGFHGAFIQSNMS